MNTLDEIKAAADSLTEEQKRELMQFLVARLHASGSRFRGPRQFTSEQVAGWIAEDEADMQRLLVKTNAAFVALKRDPEAWEQELKERREWGPC